MTVIGLDLSGSPIRKTGFAIISGRNIELGTLKTDDEIIGLCLKRNPEIVAIDAPLSMPKSGCLRSSDREMIRRGLRVFPPTFSGMISLTRRGISISSSLGSAGIKVIEVHPRSSGILLFRSCKREDWIRGMRKMGFYPKPAKTEHEIDACLAAITGYLHLRGRTKTVGCHEEGEMVIPSAPLQER
ncbi:MAG: DUF429 domain-containing protein [Candidatus Hadarchaeales archaeon]